MLLIVNQFPFPCRTMKSCFLTSTKVVVELCRFLCVHDFGYGQGKMSTNVEKNSVNSNYNMNENSKIT